MTAHEVCYMAQVKRFEWTATQGMRDRKDHECRESFSIKWQRPNLDVVMCNVDASFNKSLARMGMAAVSEIGMVHLSRQLQVGPTRFWKCMKGKPSDFHQPEHAWIPTLLQFHISVAKQIPAFRIQILK
ncbi:hypothetical protein A2U01_0000178 [Trifolium medium]|uniref:Uncharacterized protein n=1 Tax=Trifolium medium TaxID=97028 RepID=A0A392LWV0_9FABA|nr:hypothetical protein [Trifolium medium]